MIDKPVFEPVSGIEFSPSTPASLDSIEVAVGHKLPSDYRNFLLRYGAVAFYEGGFVTALDSDSETDTEFAVLSLHGTGVPHEAAEFVNRWQVYSERIPRNLLPIGADAFGDQFCISINGPDTGSVYFIDTHLWYGVEETWSVPKANSTGTSPPPRPVLLAHSFDEFIARIKPNSD